MAMPTSAAASAGASFTPSPAMATTRPSRRSFSTTALFCSGSTSASTSAMPSRRATASAVVRLSPVSITTRTPSCAQRLQRVRRRRLDRVGDGEDGRGLAVDRERRSRSRRPGAARSASPSSAAVSTPCSPQEAGIAQRDACGPRPCPARPCRRASRNPTTSASASLRSSAAATMASGKRMLARALQRWRPAAAPRPRRSPARRRSRPPWACPRSACRSCRPPGCRSAPCAPAPRRS